MRVLFQSEHARLEHDELRGIVRFVRTSVPFATVGDAAAAFGALADVASRLDRPALGLLSDVREATGRNDPEFEKATAPPRERMFEHFARRAVLVRTAAGRLQIQRLSRDSGETMVFLDEAEALAYLAARPTRSDRPRPAR